MLISVKNRFIFISNTKTASMSIEAALADFSEVQRGGSPARKHIKWRDVQEEYSFIFENPKYNIDSFFRFGVIREPLDWFVSWYNYRKNNQKIAAPLDPDMTLEEFWRLDDWVKKDPVTKDVNYQKSYFTDVDGECRFNAIIPFHMLKIYLPLVLEEIGIDVSLPRLNVSKGSLSISQVPADLANEIRKYWDQDYEFLCDWEQKLRSQYGADQSAKGSQ